MSDVVHNLTSNEDIIIPLVAISGGLAVVIIAIIFGAVRRMVMSTNLEKSRREIAAYIAEGSMTPDDGERLLNAGKSHNRCG